MTEREMQDRLNELNRQLEDLGNQCNRASHTYTATITLYNVAVSAGDSKGQDDHRLTAHTMLDSILDAGAAIFKCEEEIRQITRIFMEQRFRSN